MILFLLLFLLPSQLALHFWPSWSLVHGIRVDYLSPAIYLTDILILILLFLNRPRTRIPLFIITFCVLNLLVAYQPLISLYKYARLLEYYLLFKYLVKNWDLRIGIWGLSLSVIWTSLLAWAQFIKQSSIGGIMYWLGERTFNVTTPGIAKIAVDGHLLLRPYATLPHPNALAGFLLVAGLILYYLKKISKTDNWLLMTGYLVAFATIPLTFSRTAILLETLILTFFILKFQIRKLFKFLVLVLTFAFCVLILIAFKGSSDSLSQRLLLNQSAIQTIIKHPLLGVGLGNFIPAAAPLLRQPVHNIYLLLASELGLPALFIIIYLIIKKLFKIKNWSLVIPVLVVLTIGLVDHYWLTLHQNILLLVILMSLVYESISSHR